MPTLGSAGGAPYWCHIPFDIDSFPYVGVVIGECDSRVDADRHIATDSGDGDSPLERRVGQANNQERCAKDSRGLCREDYGLDD